MLVSLMLILIELLLIRLSLSNSFQLHAKRISCQGLHDDDIEINGYFELRRI